MQVSCAFALGFRQVMISLTKPSLPTVKRKLRSKLDEITRELAQLPELPNNVELEIKTSLHSFADTARATIESFAESFGHEPEAFRNCLLHIKPRFVMKDPSDIPIVEISDDESDAGSVATVQGLTPSKRRTMPPPATTPKRARTIAPLMLNGNTNHSGEVKQEEGREGAPPASPPKKNTLPPPYDRFTPPTNLPRTLREVRYEIETKMSAGMPDVIPARVYADLAIKAIIPWKGPMDVFLKQTMGLLRQRLEGTLGAAFSNLRKRLVFTEVKKHLKTYLIEQQDITAKFLTQLYRKEAGRLVTFNKETFSQYQRETEQELTRFRHLQRLVANGMAEPGKYVPLEQLSQNQRADEAKQMEKTRAQIGPDRFEREVKVMAYVRAYYRLAAFRFADDVAQSILCLMIPEIRRDLPQYLQEQLGVVGRGPDQARAIYERLMEEDPATAEKRSNLKTEKERFEKALASIESLQTGAAVDEDTQLATEVGFEMSMNERMMMEDI